MTVLSDCSFVDITKSDLLKTSNDRHFCIFVHLSEFSKDVSTMKFFQVLFFPIFKTGMLISHNPVVIFNWRRRWGKQKFKLHRNNFFNSVKKRPFPIGSTMHEQESTFKMVKINSN